MKVPRFRIAWLIAFVAVAALEFGAIRALHDFENRLILLTHSYHLPGMIFAWVHGALPMANVLVVALVIGHRRRGNRRFLWGFEVFGATALALYVAAASLYTEELVQPFINLVLR